MEPRLISLVINTTANSTQRLQIFPSVYHSLVIMNLMCWANSSVFGGVSVLKTLCYSYIIAFAIYDHNFQKGFVRQKLVSPVWKKWVTATYCWG